MIIRKATKKDIPQVIEMIKENSPKYPKKLALQELNEMFSRSLYPPTFIVVEDKKEIMAFGGYSNSGVDDMIYNLFWINTNSEHSGKGYGRKLIENIIKIIKKEKSPKAKMIILSTKIPKYFNKFGFKSIGQKYDGDYVLMAKRLK